VTCSPARTGVSAHAAPSARRQGANASFAVSEWISTPPIEAGTKP
jgi:hypothetical protein